MLAVHLGAVLTPTAALIGFALLVPILVWSARAVADEELPRLGVVAAAFFVASQVHFPTGVGSVHLLLNGFAGVTLGRRAPVALLAGLLLQALLFAHGSPVSLGVNAVVYCLPALAARPLLRAGGRLRAFARGALVGGVVAALTVLMSALALALGGEAAVRAATPVVLAMNLPVVAVEAVAVGFLVSYLSQVRPDFLEPGRHPAGGSG